MRRSAVSWLVATLMLATVAASAPAAPPTIKLLFLGDNGHHEPPLRFKQLSPVMAARGIQLTYSERIEDLNARALAAFDGLIVYANIERISPEQEKALLDYVAGGKGFVPLHCASYCFLNSPKYVELVGAQFLRHGTGVFRTSIALSDHPLMKSFEGFESWDETYVHHRHNEKDRTVLEYRVDDSGREPWTWVRTHGKGRVFYTAWGHDQRTWSNPGFHNLVERGIRWAVGQDPATVPAFVDHPAMNPKRTDVKPVEFVSARLPFYPAGRQWGVTGDPITQMQAPLAADESLKHMVTPVGFELKLFAAEPQIGKAICMNWDERGRLWLAETVDYPNDKQPSGQGNDRIRICEDTDGDGRADKFTIFADKLSIPTSLVFCRGGVVVHQPPETLFLKDTDGDDVADERRVLFTGWQTNDTHAGPSNLRYGLDNWLYGIVGYAGFEGEIAGQRLSFRTGFYRFAPDGSKFEFLRNTNNNSWGVGLSEEGVLFGSTANGNPSEYMPIANRYYEGVRGWSSTVLRGIAGNPQFQTISDRVRQVDYHGRFTAAAGHALYTARRYPREYWNRVSFVTEPTAHIVATFQIEPDGGGFSSKIGWNLVASDDDWSAPIMAEIGPDGNVWILDWYNIIVQHNPTPFGFRTGKGNAYEIDLRDKKHGRVYRLSYTGGGNDAVDVRPLSLRGATPEQLVAALARDNMLWRLHAQRLLVERGQRDVVPALVKLVQHPSVDGIGLNVAAIHALWTLHGLGAIDDKSQPDVVAAVTAALRHPSAGVRRNAIQVFPRNERSADAIVECGALSDPDGQVRLAALLALAEMPASDVAAQAVAKTLTDPIVLGDTLLLDAATAAAARHDAALLRLVARAGSPLAAKEPAIKRLAIVAEHYARGGPRTTIGSLVAALAGAEPAVAETIVAGLARGWPKDAPAALDKAADDALVAFVEKASPAARGQLVTIASRLGSKRLAPYSAKIAAALAEQASDEKLAESARLKAAAQLVDFRFNDPAAVSDVLKLLSVRSSPELASGLIEAAARSAAPEAGKALVERLDAVTPAARPAVVRALLSRSAWTDALLDAIDQGKLQLGELSLDQKQALLAHPDSRLAARAKQLLKRGGGLPNADRQKVLEELLPLAKRKGDATLGKQVFIKQCSKCHTHGSEGAKVGPDLTGMAVHPKEELLVNLIDPSRSVEGNYRVYTVTTADGRLLTGLLASESKTSIELFDAEGKKQVLQRDDIDELKPSTKSLMPDGFEKQVTADELANLLEFLTQRGRFVPLPLAKAATVVSTRGIFFGNESRGEDRMIFRDWSPKTFEGVPFQLIDPQGDRVPNLVLLYGPQGTVPPRMPKSVSLPCNSPAKTIHMLGGVSGWGYPASGKGSVTMIVRLHYDDGKTEDHALKNGEHFADYIRRVDVPDSKFAFQLRGQQLRYLAVAPERKDTIREIELVKGPDDTAPIVMAVTVETGN